MEHNGDFFYCHNKPIIPGKPEHYSFKFVVIGEFGVGKTAIVRRYNEGKFSSNYKVTIGADFSNKTILWDSSTMVTVQLWDIAGNDKFGNMTSVYYRHASGCIVVFDLSRFTSFQGLTKWTEEIISHYSNKEGCDIPLVLMANKCDIGENCVPDTTINDMTKSFGFVNWFKTSAKENININESINCLISAAIKKVSADQKTPEQIQQEKGVIRLGKMVKKRKSQCCR